MSHLFCFVKLKKTFLELFQNFKSLLEIMFTERIMLGTLKTGKVGPKTV